MTIFKIVAYVLVPLHFFQCFPCVTCQQERKLSTGTTVVVILLGILSFSCFILSIIGFCSTLLLVDNTSIVEEVREVARTRSGGIDKDIIESFPFFSYSEVKGLKIGKGGVECAICLIEFEDEDTLRWMPPCSHIFHANCIDVWLSSQCTCPVCRANLSLDAGDERFSYPTMDLETGNAQTGVLESTDKISNSDNNANYTTPRSRSTGLLSSWSTAEILFPRSHSTGHSFVQLGQNLDRFTLLLPEEVQKEFVRLNLIRRSHMTLPQARSSRQGYRSGGVGNERIGFSQDTSVRGTSQANVNYFVKE